MRRLQSWLISNTAGTVDPVMLIGLALTLLVMVYAASDRLAQLERWSENREAYYVDQQPLMTARDAYYTLRLASLYQRGEFEAGSPDLLLHYQTRQTVSDAEMFWPFGEDLEWQQQRMPERLPGLSLLLASATQLFGSAEKAGLYLLPCLSVLFLPLVFLYARQMGYPAAGLMGVLVAAFSVDYYRRTSPGWVDTDALNLFFPWLASLLILKLAPKQSTRRLCLLSASLGITLFLYYLWYGKAALSLAYWGTLSVYLLMQGYRMRTMLLCLFVCVITSHPAQLLEAAPTIFALTDRYLFGGNPAEGTGNANLWFPNAMLTVGEQLKLPGLYPLTGVFSQPWIALTGCLGFILLSFSRWRQMIPLLPLLFIASLILTGKARFAMYLAPFVGIGLGVLITWLEPVVTGQRLSFTRPVDSANASTARSAWMYAAVVLVFLAILRPFSGAGKLAPPAISAETYAALVQLREQLPQQARLWSWWDYGFAISYASERAIYHDGSTQYTPQTHLVAASLVDSSQARLVDTVRFVDAQGNRGIEQIAATVASRDALLAAIVKRGAELPAAGDIYLLFTESMIQDFPAMAFLSGQPAPQDAGDAPLYRRLYCSDLASYRLNCEGFHVDLDTGRFSDGRTLREALIVRGGRVVKTMAYDNRAGTYLQILVGDDSNIDVYTLPASVFHSNFNQIFLLGNIDQNRFEEVYSRYPAARVYRVKP